MALDLSCLQHGWSAVRHDDTLRQQTTDMATASFPLPQVQDVSSFVVSVICVHPRSKIDNALTNFEIAFAVLIQFS